MSDINIREYKQLDDIEDGYTWFIFVGENSTSPMFVAVAADRVWDGTNHEQTYWLSQAEDEDFEPKKIHDLAMSL